MKITRLDPSTRQPTADVWTLSRSTRLLLIGREAPANIQLDSPDVSPRHAELVWQSGTVIVRYLASINGIVYRNNRILRTSLQDQDIFSIGGVPFQATIEPEDLAARRSRLLTLAGASLGGIVVAVLVWAIIHGSKTAPEAPAQEPSPIMPQATDPAFQKMSDQYASAAELLDESRRIIADGLDDLHAAELLQKALALNPNLSEADLLLKGLQGSHGAAIQQQIDSLVSAGRFQDALDQLDRQKALVGAPDAVQKTQEKIAQRIQFQNALTALDEGDLDTADKLLSSLPVQSIPELPAALDRLAKSRAAVAWAERLESLADQNKLAEVQRLADDENLHAPYLTADAMSEVHGALARANAIGDIQKLIAAGNTYVVAQYLNDIPDLDQMLQPLRTTLEPQADALRRAAVSETAKTTSAPVPADLPDALASYEAAKAFASLCIIHMNNDDFSQYRLHSGRWSAYLAAIVSRAQAYVAQGAREEARAILRPVLPLLDDYDPATATLRSLEAQITPVAFTPATARLLENKSAAKQEAQ